jgi:multiple sugar transport system ATP-binding protein
MNLLDADLVSVNDELRVRGDGFDLPVPARMLERAQQAGTPQVTVGLRPEHFSVSASGEGDYAPVTLGVTVAEYIGSSQFLAATLGGKPITATVDVGPDAEPMESGTYFFDANRLYLFDRQTGLAL